MRRGGFGDGSVSRWLPVVAWAVLISVLSSDAFSGERTGGLLMPLLDHLFPDASRGTLLGVHARIRKLAHVVEYAVLAVLLFRALERPERSLATIVWVALLSCAGYSVLDELRQSLVPSRVGAPLDVALDTVGAALGLGARVLARAAFSVGRRSPA